MLSIVAMTHCDVIAAMMSRVYGCFIVSLVVVVVDCRCMVFEVGVVVVTMCFL